MAGTPIRRQRKLSAMREATLAMKVEDSEELRRLESGGMPVTYAEIEILERPSHYNEEIVTEMLRELQGGETLKGMCRKNPHRYPCDSTFRTWVYDDVNGLYARYVRARDLGLDARAEAMFEIVDNPSNEPRDVIRDRLRFDATRWYLSKMAPKRYGDKLDVTSHGEKIVMQISKDDDDLC